MDNETVYLPGKIRDRIQDLMKSRKVTQAELAAKIGCSESALSRFISGKTDKLGDESIIRIARAFEVSTDFLLGEVDEPDRKNYDVSELGLSVEAARNLYTQKVNPKIVSYLLENPQFADTTYQIARYLDNELTAGFAAQNQLYSMVASMLGASPQAADEVKSLRTPIDQADLSSIQSSFRCRDSVAALAPSGNNVVFVTEKRSHASKLQNTLGSVHDGDLVLRHQFLAGLLIVQAIGVVVGTGF